MEQGEVMGGVLSWQNFGGASERLFYSWEIQSEEPGASVA